MNECKAIIFLLLLTGCTQTGPKFINCSDEAAGFLALDIAMEHMEHVGDVIMRTNFICKQQRPLPYAECYIARTGNQDYGNRGLIIVRDKYIGECIIHELYHVESYEKYGDFCSSHSKNCNWDYVWLEKLLDDYQLEKQ